MKEKIEIAAAEDAPIGKGVHIFVCDDEVDVLDYVPLIIADRFPLVEIHTFENPEAAERAYRKSAKAGSPRLLIADGAFANNRSAGIECMQRLQAEQANGPARFILHTGDSTKQAPLGIPLAVKGHNDLLEIVRFQLYDIRHEIDGTPIPEKVTEAVKDQDARAVIKRGDDDKLMHRSSRKFKLDEHKRWAGSGRGFYDENDKTYWQDTVANQEPVKGKVKTRE